MSDTPCAVRDLLVTALRDPEAALGWHGEQLNLLLYQARRAGLLGRLAETLGKRPDARWPPALRAHFEAAARVCRAQQAEIRREAAFLVSALDGLDEPTVLLKGAAYVMAGLPAAHGRVFGDIDLMVPRAAIDRAEIKLKAAGWQGSHASAYDQRFYREWMHELPPMEHQQRRTALDVHHTIVPLTGRLKPDAASMFERARPVPGYAGLFVLGPEDMVLHSMTHLFVNDDTSFALRDLSDLDLLLRHFAAQDAGFWPALLGRARAQGLLAPLHDTLLFARRLLHTPVPADVAHELGRIAPQGAGRWLMCRAVWPHVLRSPHPSAARAGTAPALAALYLRGHWLRMPMGMMVRHLAVKSWMRWRERDDADTGERALG
jgi:hypothetical protein